MYKNRDLNAEACRNYRHNDGHNSYRKNQLRS